MSYPKIRLRRLRENEVVRNFVSENRLSVEDLVQPFFVKEGLGSKLEISSMPGQFQHSLNSFLDEAKKIEQLGIRSIILFGIPDRKDQRGTSAYHSNSIVQKAIRKLKNKRLKLLVIADVCLCEYLSHGHCGLIKKGRIQNDETLRVLAKTALSYAEAGADIVAPSDMMDGRVRAIRSLLDEKGHTYLPILSYAVKYASSFYAPFREAAESVPSFGDRKSYQMNFANSKEALREARLDVQEGADLLLVKPALGYTDIISEIKEELSCPVGAYSVSGEYSMIKAAHERGWIDQQKVVFETHMAYKRAGASFILTYWAKDLALWYKNRKFIG